MRGVLNPDLFDKEGCSASLARSEALVGQRLGANDLLPTPGQRLTKKQVNLKCIFLIYGSVPKFQDKDIVF